MTELLLKTKCWQGLNYYIMSGSQTVILELLNEDKLYPMANVNNSHGNTLSPSFIWVKPEKIIHYNVFKVHCLLFRTQIMNNPHALSRVLLHKTWETTTCYITAKEYLPYLNIQFKIPCLQASLLIWRSSNIQYLLGRLTQCLQSKAVVKTSLVMEQHCVRVVYKIWIVTPLLFTTYFTGRLGNLAEFCMVLSQCLMSIFMHCFIDFYYNIGFKLLLLIISTLVLFRWCHLWS